MLTEDPRVTHIETDQRHEIAKKARVVERVLTARQERRSNLKFEAVVALDAEEVPICRSGLCAPEVTLDSLWELLTAMISFEHNQRYQPLPQVSADKESKET